MKPNSIAIMALIVAVLAVLMPLAGHQRATDSGQAVVTAGKQESAFDRVMRTGVLRCAYFLWPPYFNKDVTTGQFSGFTYDVAAEIGRLLNLKIEWTETFVGQEVDTLKSGKADAVCSSQVPVNPVAAKYLEHGTPYTYVGIYAIGRAGEDRFKTLTDINQPDIRVSYMESDVSDVLKQAHFPKAANYALANTIDPQQMMYDVVTNKADVTLVDPPSLIKFLSSNPGTLKIVASRQVLATYPIIFSTAKGERELVQLLSDTVIYMRDVGILDQILDRNEVDKFGVSRVAVPYRESPFMKDVP